MSTKSQIYREVLRDMERIRNYNSAVLRDKQTDLYSKIPRLAEIDREINIIGVRLTRLILERNQDYIEKSQRLR